MEHPAHEPPVLNGMTAGWWLIRSSAFNLLGSGVSNGMLLLLSVACARWMSVDDFAAMSFVQSSVQLIGVIIGAAIGVAAGRAVISAGPAAAAFPMLARLAARLTDQWSTAGLVGITVVALLVPGDMPPWSWPLLIAAVIAFWANRTQVYQGLLGGAGAFQRLAVIMVARSLVTGVGILGGHAVGGFAGAVLGFLVGSIAIEMALRHHLGARSTSNAADGQVADGALAGPATWLIAGSIAASGATLVAHATMFHTSAHEVAAVSMLMVWRMVLMFATASMSQPFATHLARTYETDRSRFGSAVLMNAIATVGISSAVAGGFVVAADTMLSWYGHAVSVDRQAVLLTALSVPLAASAGVCSNVMTARKHFAIGFAMNVVWAASFLIVLRWMPSQDHRAFAAALALSYGIHIVLASGYMVVTKPTRLSA